MDKKRAFEIVKKVGAQHGKADYILNEVHSYLTTRSVIDKTFREWFIRQYKKYQKGAQ